MEQFANSSTTTLNGAITNVATSLVVTSASTFPAGGTFRLLVELEIMIVTAVAGATFTVTRGAEGTAAAAHSSLVTVKGILTKGAVEQLKLDVAPVIGAAEVVPETVSSWKDTAASVAPLAPKAYVLNKRASGTTTNGTVTANQIVDAGGTTVGGVDFLQPLNSTMTVEITADLKVIGAANGGMLSASGTFVRGVSGIPVRVGADDLPTPKLTAGIAGTTCRLNIEAAGGIDFEITPGVALAIASGIVRTHRVRID